jgi:hypothetical protein
LNEYGEIKINKHVLILFLIRRYNDEILCNVVPMHEVLLLLGRLRKFDRKVVYDGFRNRYFFVKDEKSITFVSFSP